MALAVVAYTVLPLGETTMQWAYEVIAAAGIGLGWWGLAWRGPRPAGSPLHAQMLVANIQG